jgi:hypothetical protein
MALPLRCDAQRMKELVLRNFSGVPVDQLLERMIELPLYTEDKL